MDPKRLVVVGYLVLGVIILLFLSHGFIGGTQPGVLEALAARFSLPNPKLGEGLDFKVTDLIALVLVIGGGAFAWTNVKSRSASLDVANELMRVTWPSWEETRISTFAVVFASLIAAVVLFGIDRFSYELMIEWLPSLWGKL
jgi:preprotein translocase subunit SecE